MPLVAARLRLGLSVLALVAGPSLAKSPPTDRLGVVDTLIHEIQGDGLSSPLLGTRVTTEGVVTAVVADGYFLQSLPGREDADANTSEGIFIYTGALDPAIAVGQQREVEGLVEEVLAGGSPHQLTLTRLADTQSVLLASGIELPAPVALVDVVLETDPLVANERFEGMRVAPPSLMVTTPTGGDRDEVTGVATPDGQFDAIGFRSSRPFREPGLSLLDAGEPPLGKTLSFFDTNPERLRVDLLAQPGTTLIDVRYRDRVTISAAVMHYRDGAYTLLPDPGATLRGGFRATIESKAPYAAASELSVAWLDLDRLFDDADDPALDEPVLDPAAYQRRLAKHAAAICDYLRYPDIIAVDRVENPRVLDDLAALIELNQTPCYGAPQQYQPHGAEGRGADGLDAGFLVGGRDVLPGEPRVEVLAFTLVGADATLSSPTGITTPLFERPSMLLSTRITDTEGEKVEIRFLASQLQPLAGIDSPAAGRDGWATVGDEVMARRAAQAAFLAAWLDARQQAEPDEALVLLGGFEAHDFNDGRVDVLGAIKGTEAAPAEVWLPVGVPVQSPLSNPLPPFGDWQGYTRIRDGQAEATDHALLNARVATWSARLIHTRLNTDFSVTSSNTPGPLRSGSRDPVLLRLQVPAFLTYDASISMSAPPVQSPATGGSAIVQVRNHGPDRSAALTVEIDANLAAEEYHVTPQTGAWTCAPPVALAEGSRARCEIGGMPADFNNFNVVIPASPALAGRTITFTARVAGDQYDTQPGNETATASTEFSAAVDLRVEARPEYLEKLPGDNVAFSAVLVNESVNLPGRVELEALLDAPATSVTSYVSSGAFVCGAATDIAPNRSRVVCVVEPPLVQTIGVVFFNVQTALGDGGRVIGFQATATSTTAEATPLDNRGTTSWRVPDEVDLQVTSFVDPDYAYPLDSGLRLGFSFTHANPGVARNPRVEFDLDLTPAEIVGVEKINSPDTPDCLPAQPLDGGTRARVICLLPPLYQNSGLGDPVESLLVLAQPNPVPGLAERDVAVEARIVSDSQELSPADNTVWSLARLDMTTNVGISVIPPGAAVAEPGIARFQLNRTLTGVNLPRNLRVRLEFDRTFDASDVGVETPAGGAVHCDLVAAAAGRHAIDCPMWPSHSLFVEVRTRAALAGGTLNLTATVHNDLRDVDPANDSSAASVAVVSVADLCLGLDCDGGWGTVPRKVGRGSPNPLVYGFRNRGPGTARDAIATIEIGLPPVAISGHSGGQACDAAVSIGNDRSRMRCPLGDVPADGLTRELELEVDPGNYGGSSLPFSIDLSSAAQDTIPSNDLYSFPFEMADVSDLSIAVDVKPASFPNPALFIVTPASDGVAPFWASRVRIQVVTPGVGAWPEVLSAAWNCADIGGGLGGLWARNLECTRFQAQQDTDPPDRIELVVPASQFTQIGSEVRVTASFAFSDVPYVDLVPANNTSAASHLVDGRSTRSTKGSTKPTPAYGGRRQARPTPLRTEAAPSARD